MNSNPAITLLRQAYNDFMLSRRAMKVSSKTLDFYKYTAGKFVEYLEAQNISSPTEISPSHVWNYQANLNEYADTTQHAHSRAIKTLLYFWLEEGYIDKKIKIKMPRLKKKRLPMLEAQQVGIVLAACTKNRDKALLLTAVDTGLRRFELVSLSWNDIDLETGIIHLNRGKGGDSRTVIVGIAARSELLAYKSSLKNNSKTDPIFQTDSGRRLTGQGVRSILNRLSRRSGVKFSAHALRRSFATLSRRAGMDSADIQKIMGHKNIEMTLRYTQMVDDDIQEKHNLYGPIDNLPRLTRK